jgi:hypothetical protein
MHDHGQSSPQIVNLTDAARHRRQSVLGLGEKIEGCKQRGRIRPRRLRQTPDYPSITTLLFRLADLPARPPDNRVPPVERHYNQFQHTDPLVAPPQMGQFMQEQRGPLFLRQMLP